MVVGKSILEGQGKTSLFFCQGHGWHFSIVRTFVCVMIGEAEPGSQGLHSVVSVRLSKGYRLLGQMELAGVCGRCGLAFKKVS